MQIDDPFEHWQDLSQEGQINTMKALEFQPERRLDVLSALLPCKSEEGARGGRRDA